MAIFEWDRLEKVHVRLPSQQWSTGYKCRCCCYFCLLLGPILPSPTLPQFHPPFPVKPHQYIVFKFTTGCSQYNKSINLNNYREFSSYILLGGCIRNSMHAPKTQDILVVPRDVTQVPAENIRCSAVILHSMYFPLGVLFCSRYKSWTFILETLSLCHNFWFYNQS